MPCGTVQITIDHSLLASRRPGSVACPDRPGDAIGTLADITTSDSALSHSPRRYTTTRSRLRLRSVLEGAVIQRILVATDFSRSADTAWRWAVDVARRFGAELRLVHVAMPMSGEAAPNPQDDDRGVALAQRLLEERAAALPTSRVKTILRRGEPAHVLSALARDEYIDLLVVGTHEHLGAGDILIGSVAERLIRLAPCTVVVVKLSNASVDPAD